MADHGTCSGCGAETDPDDYCCAECADAHDEAVRAEERKAVADLVCAASAEALRLGRTGESDRLCKLLDAIRARGEVPRG